MSAMTPRGGSQQVLRAWNLRRLLECLEHGPMSQVELAAAAGLSEATVSNLVRVLLEDRLAVQEAGLRNGRRAKLLRLPDAHRAWQVGIDIGRTRIRVVASPGPADPEGAPDGRRPTYEAAIPVPCPYSHAIDTVARLVDRCAADGRTRADLSGAVVAVPGLVRVSREPGAQGLLGEGYHQHMGWGSVPLARDLGAALGTEVVVENDCNLAALAEMHAGAARPYRDFMFVLGEAYTAGGLVLGGEIYRGGGGVAGEFGHCVVEPGGRPCWCGGRGCLETVAGEAALLAEVTGVTGLTGGSGIAGVTGVTGVTGLSPRAGFGTPAAGAGAGEPGPQGAGRPGAPRDLAEIVARALAGDPACQAAVTKAGTAIGSLVGAVATPLDLDCVVVGGTLARAGNLLLEAVRAHLTLYVGRLHPATVAVLAAELGDDAPLRGALLQARHTILARS
ncbi:ROK family transcriptional regulator [Streptodolium elevatio]|uniref:ROK family transcriptional regulator n=1 Tax=Streptodolium elevatio TaxID=3157996 RepID=A0ABV3DPI8_9ACTN